jgi:hypothetical protein
MDWSCGVWAGFTCVLAVARLDARHSYEELKSMTPLLSGGGTGYLNGSLSEQVEARSAHRGRLHDSAVGVGKRC